VERNAGRAVLVLVLEVRSAVLNSGDRSSLRLGGTLSRAQRLKEEGKDFGANESEGREMHNSKQISHRRHSGIGNGHGFFAHRGCFARWRTFCGSVFGLVSVCL
jgi:hypothetical protein